MSRYYFLATLLTLVLFSCTQNRKPVEHSFYYWKTVADFDTASTREIRKLGVNHFYLHYFDVDWSEKYHAPVPVGNPYADDILPGEVTRYTPVVYITNRTFEHIQLASDCDSLAAHVTDKIAERTKAIRDVLQHHTVSYRYERFLKQQGLQSDTTTVNYWLDDEAQIDCDWTATTKEKYFRFLKKFKELNKHKIISATIRLYPYKYQKKMGVPPVDKGMLMCYNLGGIEATSTQNSVFDLAEVKEYLGGKYPLKLDVALPVFGWYVWFRNGRLKGIVHQDAYETNGYLSAMKSRDNIYTIASDTVLDDNYYREGDELREEFPDAQRLVEAARLLKKEVPGCSRITFFDWNLHSVKKYENVVQEVFDHY